MEVKMFCTGMGMFVGKLKEERDDSYVIQDPKILISDPKSNQLSFADFPPFSKQKEHVFFKSQNICKPYDVIDEVKKQYLSQISGIDLINSKSSDDSKVKSFMSHIKGNA